MGEQDLRILITGAEGFVGSNLARRLCKEHQVIGLDYLVDRRKTNLPEDTYYINGDLSRIDISSLPEVDLVIHLAAISIERISEVPIYHNINIASTFRVLEYVIKNEADLIFSSSASVYGSGVNFSEDTDFNPLSLYSSTKIEEEKRVRLCCETYGLNVTILRYSNCYGDTTYIKNKFYPGKKDVIRIFMENALSNKPLPVIKGQTRDFTYKDDVIDATTSIIGLNGVNTFNVATGVETPVESIPPIIEKVLDKKVNTHLVSPRKIDNLKRRSLNIEKISEYWKPKYDLKTGIELYAKQLQ
jgi:UDP-glucose 4-epimerase